MKRLHKWTPFVYHCCAERVEGQPIDARYCWQLTPLLAAALHMVQRKTETICYSACAVATAQRIRLRMGGILAKVGSKSLTGCFCAACSKKKECFYNLAGSLHYLV